MNFHLRNFCFLQCLINLQSPILNLEENMKLLVTPNLNAFFYVYSIAMTTASCILSLAMIPLLLWIYSLAFDNILEVPFSSIGTCIFASLKRLLIGWHGIPTMSSGVKYPSMCVIA